jgi:hypothetical protein
MARDVVVPIPIKFTFDDQGKMIGVCAARPQGKVRNGASTVLCVACGAPVHAVEAVRWVFYGDAGERMVLEFCKRHSDWLAKAVGNGNYFVSDSR